MCYSIAMNKSAVIHARIEPETKDLAEGVLNRLGLSPTEAIRIFYQQICLRRGLPFIVKIPNKLTRATLVKSSRRENVKQFDNLNEMFASWDQ